MTRIRIHCDTPDGATWALQHVQDEAVLDEGERCEVCSDDPDQLVMWIECDDDPVLELQERLRGSPFCPARSSIREELDYDLG